MAKSLSEAKAHNNLRKSVQSVAKKLSEAKAPLKSMVICGHLWQKGRAKRKPLLNLWKFVKFVAKKLSEAKAPLKSVEIRVICGKKP